MDERVDLVPGTLDMLAMKAVSAEALHGFGIARWIEGVTGDRMEKKGWLASEWRRTDRGRRARYYRLTDQGEAELRARRERWESSAWAVQQILDAEV